MIIQLSGMIYLQGSNHFTKKSQCAMKTYLKGGVEKVFKTTNYVYIMYGLP